MLNSPMPSIFQHFHAIPLRSPPQPSGQLPRWGAKNNLPINLIALLQWEVSFHPFTNKKEREKKSLTYTAAKISQLNTHLNIYSFVQV